ncbi:MAG TPA: flavodoxin-dependent (E)-4-hydroxy-3-methylbut-2-enyl-diphosphate synthase [Candidatus Limiplasma sp.]|nr:flavodoxin-dependent (E)-4-hydroxy-3-methylbut-2-enyl-diphosphate synthase [Candidatus Limiplasma sp.]
MTRQFSIGTVPIGGGAPVTVQSMTNTDTHDVMETLAQINALHIAGADIVRVSVYDDACLPAFKMICAKSPVPVVADIHYRADLAVGALEAGAAKVRINPGNIGSADKVKLVADCARAHGAPIRVGVNSGSMEKDILAKYGGVTAEGMLESALRHARLLEAAGFHDIVLSLKSSDAPLTVKANRLAAAACDYPLHLGVTEAGLPGEGHVKSAVGIGALLLDGIGDTIRVSLSGDPVPEVAAGISILKACGLRKGGVNIVSCPTCGRTSIDVAGIAAQVQEVLKDCALPLTVAVMGCVVNGPGEAKEADFGVAGGGNGKGVLFQKGMPPEPVHGDLAALLIERVRRYEIEQNGTHPNP